MIAAAIIVLREILEICLVVGMIYAALKEIPNKKKLLLTGISVGITISIILALSLRQVSNLFDGNGQEVLNIVILTSSILCIAWTLLWVNKQGKSLYHKIITASQRMIGEEASVWPMILIITLSISREGAELILFLYGVSAGGAHVADLVYGSIVGASIGIALGSLLYIGLLKIPARYFFRTINIMLIILAAGMAAQLANYLTAGDIISSLSTAIWDSSKLINEEGVAGKLLHGLIGYSSQPTGLQLLFYCSTIIILFRLIRKN